jgi:hypothetical protein
MKAQPSSQHSGALRQRLPGIDDPPGSSIRELL